MANLPAHLQSDSGLQSTISEVQREYEADFAKRSDVSNKPTPGSDYSKERKSQPGDGVD